MIYPKQEAARTEEFNLHRRVVAHMTSSSWRQIPHVTYIYEPDITDFYEEFSKLAKERAANGFKITFNTVMLKVIIEGLLSSPVLNSCIEYSPERVEGRLHILKDINISIPWLLPDGKLITPAILHSEKMSINELSIYMSDLSKRIQKTNIDEMLYRAAFSETVRELKKCRLGVLKRVFASKFGDNRIQGLKGRDKRAYYQIPENERLSQKNLMLGTVTVSNVGSLYKEQRGTLGLLEIIPPQIFAVGIGSVQERPGVYIRRNGKKEIGIRNVLPMCLAFDHRAVDFSSIIPFIKRLDEIFAKPVVIHKW